MAARSVLTCLGLALFIALSLPRPSVSQVPGPNIRVNQDLTTQPQNETSIAISPTNPSILVAGWNDLQTGSRRAGYGYSTNGGLNWSSGLMPGNVGGYPFQGNPSVAADKDGNFYYCFMSFIQAGQPDGIYVSKSTAWFSPVPVVEHQAYEDKPYIAVDQSDSLIYVTWTRGSSIFFARSIDRGASYGDIRAVSDVGSGINYGSVPAVGPNGELYVAWLNSSFDEIRIDKSTNGGVDFGVDNLVSSVTRVGRVNLLDRINSFPTLAVNPMNGHVYVAWADGRYGPPPPAIPIPDVLFVRSTDGGSTWSQPINVANNQAAGFVNDQFFPWMTVNSAGKISLSFYDRRDFPNNDLVHVYLAESVDGGLAFLSNVRVTDQGFDLSSDPHYGGDFVGDYTGIASTFDDVYPLWTDTRNTHQDIYTAPVDAYDNSLLALAYSNKSVSSTATAWGSAQKSVYTTNWHRIFQTDGKLAYAHSQDDGSTWQGHRFISGAVQLSPSSNPALAARAENLYSVFSSVMEPDGFYRIYLNRMTAGAWLDPPLAFYSTAGEITNLSFAIASDGTGHVAWVESPPIQAPLDRFLLHGTFIVDVGTPVLAGISSVYSTSAAITNPALALDSNDKPHVVWSASNEIYYKNKVSGSWSNLFNLSSNSGVSRYPSILSSGTTIHAVWHDNYPGNYEIYYRVRSLGSWGPIQNLSASPLSSSTFPFIGGLISSAPVVLWVEDINGNKELKYTWIGQSDTGLFATTPDPSLYPTFTFRTPEPDRVRVLASWTEGSSSPYTIEDSYHDFGGVGSPIARDDLLGVSGDAFVLQQNFPNPFNPVTEIRFQLPVASHVSLTVHDLRGREVKKLIDGPMDAGYHSLTWKADGAATGVYFCRLSAGHFVQTRRMILLK